MLEKGKTDLNESGKKNVQGSVVAIIINYNGGDGLQKCIQSLVDQAYGLKEIVVVDNRSTDGSIEQSRKRFPSVSYIENSANVGWGVGCNIGIESTDSEYIALVNNDAYLDRACIGNMVRALACKEEYGSCASRILLSDNREVIEAAGVSIYRDGSSVGRGRLRPAGEYDRKAEIFCANDCCCLYRRKMLDEIGLYDPDFFIYCDETDVGWRQQLAGWKCIYEPAAVAYHAHSVSAGSYSDFKAYHVERNRLFICFKYFPPKDMFLSVFFALFRFAMQVWCSGKGVGALAEYRKKHSLLRGFMVLMKSNVDAFRKLPVMLDRRRKFMRVRNLSDRELSDLFRKYGLSVRNMAEYV